MEEILLWLAKQGVFGIVAAGALYLYLGERKDNKNLRDRLEAVATAHGDQRADQAKKHSDAFQAQATSYASVVGALRDAQDERNQQLIDQFQQHLKDADKVHHDQEDELMERLIKVHETYAEKNAKIIENAATLVESINRRSK